MRLDWAPLMDELSLWRREGLTLPIWWRDDDAMARTAQLDQLSALSEEIGVPVHIAAIPDLLEPGLPAFVATAPHLIPVVHGWRHISHAPQEAKKAEFGQMRAGAANELQLAINHLTEHFGQRLLPLFVPPWNRIDAGFMPVLTRAGYGGVSTFGPRTAGTDLLQINTHVDPIYWRGHRGLADPEALIAGAVATLRARRNGETDSDEPLGLLTHHLVHDADIWEFSAQMLRVLLGGGAQVADIAGHLQAGRSPSI